jgi:hypothetical protein
VRKRQSVTAHRVKARNRKEWFRRSTPRHLHIAPETVPPVQHTLGVSCGSVQVWSDATVTICPELNFLHHKVTPK